MLVQVHYAAPRQEERQPRARWTSPSKCGVDPERLVIDHNNEETVQDVLDRGVWAAFTIYPHTKMGNERMVEIARKYGSDQIIVDSSSADWGVSDPLAVPKTARLMLDRGIAAEGRRGDLLRQRAQGLRPERARSKEEHWLDPEPIDQRMSVRG